MRLDGRWTELKDAEATGWSCVETESIIDFVEKPNMALKALDVLGIANISNCLIDNAFLK